MAENSLSFMNKNQSKKYPPNRLPYFMDIRSLEKEDVADALKVDKETVRRWLVGETDLTHAKMIELSKLFGCEPYELIIDKEDIIQMEASYIAHHRKVVDAYLNISAVDKPLVDRFMFPNGQMEQKKTDKPIAGIFSGDKSSKKTN